MTTVFKSLLLIVCCIVAAAFLLLFLSHLSESHPDDVSSFIDSNQIIQPYELAKNPFMLNGQTAVLKTNVRPVITPFGKSNTLEIPIPGVRFANMLDETTAVYDVLIADNYVGAMSGQLLVILAPGTAQPDPMQQWKVEIHRPMLVQNGLGVEQKLAAVRFLSYVEPPHNPGSKQPAFSEPAKPASAPDQTVPGPSDTPADPPTPDQQHPAPTERVAPSPDQP